MSASETPASGPKARARLARLVSIAVALGLCVIAYIFFLSPRYLILRVSPPMADLPRGGWYYQERTTQTWSDALPGARYFLWRARASAYGPRYASWQDVIAYFDRQLTALGWEAHPNPQGLCQNHFPEAQFLPAGQNGYTAYVRKGSDPDQPIPFVCLGVHSRNGSVQGYDVVIQSVNPSFLLVFDTWLAR